MQNALDVVIASLDDDKAEDVVVLDLVGKTSMADRMVIASGRSQRHIGAMAQNLRDSLKQHLGVLASVEGMTECDWVLIDAGDVIVHLFRPEFRHFYALERLWGSNPAFMARAGGGVAAIAV